MRELPWAYLSSVLYAVLLHSHYYVVAQVTGSAEWGDWSEPSDCSRTCGGGVQYQERLCLTEDVNECSGPSKIYSSCNIQDCPAGSVDFRAEQCAKYNNIAFKEKYYEWLPYYGGESCELNCLAKGHRFYYRHAAKVVDGTPCERDSLDVCVDGVCQAVGCDKRLGSDSKFDKCHICGGNGTTCKTITGHIDVNTLEYGYNDVVLIPSGATSITFRENGPSDNYIALRNLDGEYYLNGNWVVDLTKPKEISGTTFHYKRETENNNVEYLQANGPTNEPIFISLIRQKGNSPYVVYEYSIPADVKEGTSKETYSWSPGQWSTCSRSCAQGLQQRDIKCTRRSDGTEVMVDLCDHAKKPANSQMCNNKPCPAQWHVSNWDLCSSTCGEGVQVRSVFCQQLTHEDIHAIVNEGLCKGEKPPSVQKCNADVECPKWEYGLWSKCNRLCGPGQNSRQVLCKAQHSLMNSVSDILPEQQCDSESKPAATQDCNLQPCEGREWVTSSWSGCQGSCAHGFETRNVLCSTQAGKILDDVQCNRTRKPEHRRPCSKDHSLCDVTPKWHASQWGPCSARCGAGMQNRKVVCAIHEDGKVLRIVDENKCDANHKMAIHQDCEGTDCTHVQGEWFKAPWGKCSEPCDGGEKFREVLCMWNKTATHQHNCNLETRPFSTETCNNVACNEDDLLPVGGCKATKFGCCPDRINAAEGPGFLNCPPGDPIPTGACVDSEYGCCLDQVTSAQGLFLAGCPDYTCLMTRYGCCADGHTAADGPNNEGCPQTLGCEVTAFGCCLDKKTAALGPNLRGCPPLCQSSIYGCCPDGESSANGENNEGCDDEGSGEDCADSKYGCCYDGITPATGPNKEGCNALPSNCHNSLYGCCPDGKSHATGYHLAGCIGVIVVPESGCDKTRFGCCPDGITAALGRNDEGCDSGEIEIDDCENTIFGCCADGKTIADDSNHSNCKPIIVGGCAGTRHGCCDDGKTSALDAEGSNCEPIIVGGCAGTRHGCCQDGQTSAIDAEGTNCEPIIVGGCAGTRHGCCQDGQTSAIDAEGTNCEPLVGGCSGTRHGCCKDGKTSAIDAEGSNCEPILVGGCRGTRWGCCTDGEGYATGPNQEGCVVEAGCETTLYKCCPDGKTAAEGPNYEGCDGVSQTVPDCAGTTYGCCLDGKSIARGKEFEGCREHSGYKYSCHESPFECCPDGKTPAEGPHMAGCPSRINKGAICSLPKERGACQNYSIMWYYDNTFGECVRFWYGGCGGNGNRFAEREECHRACRDPIDEHSIERCYLPKSVSRCSTYKQRFYYNPESRSCEQFSYGGCEGNKNNFETEMECEKECIVTQRPNVCSQPQRTGPCRGQFVRWFYDNNLGSCRQFIYGGCKGNDNRFETVTQCQERCNASMTELCKLPKVKGPCEADIPRWYFDSDTKQCLTFSYGGCRGNANKFNTKTECESSCHELLPKKDVDVCQLPKDKGPCDRYYERYFYNKTSGYCELFVYKGCQGNANRFENEEICRNSCNALKPVDVCTLHSNTGTCGESQVRIFFDKNTGMCRNFIYSGCDSNGNNFGTVQECRKTCSHLVRPIVPNGREHCLLAFETGPCIKNIPRWFYNAATRNCEQFIYGGCNGNRNRFMTATQCFNDCDRVSIPERTTSEKITTEITTTTAPTTTTTTTTMTTTIQTSAVCELSVDYGTCTEKLPLWYYDSLLNRCTQFVFRGCGGNGNRFDTRQACENLCVEYRPEPVGLEVCALPSKQGPCIEEIDRWYYDTEKGRCMPFSYGGCEGNQNNFGSEEECVNSCPVKDICGLPSKTGRCKASKLRYFYDKEAGTCKQFFYGGCDGNANRFLDFDSCEEVCGEEEPVFTGDVCELRSDRGPCTIYDIFWYYNTDQGRCAQFYYGGCEGNGNRFPSEAACIQQCVPATTVPTTLAPGKGMDEVCMMKKDVGNCTDYRPVWYFAPRSRSCRRFLYGGCFGNGNKFETREECQNRCLYGITNKNTATTTTTTTERVTTQTTQRVTTPTTTFDGIWVKETTKQKFDTTTTPTVSTTRTTQTTTTTAYPEYTTRRDDSGSTYPTGKTCLEAIRSGPCNDFTVRWYFDWIGARCARFWYGGCNGNGNNYITQQGCELHCLLPRAERKVPGLPPAACSLPVKRGPCEAIITRWYFDPKSKTCKDFLYGGCYANSNNFESYNLCQATCLGEQDKASVCSLPRDIGPCKADKLRYYYDKDVHRCLQFRYGGCQGNYNNFDTEEACEDYCGNVMAVTPTAPVRTRASCKLRVDPGPCQSQETRFYYDSATGECRPFLYSGCQGNLNNFVEQRECYELCSDYPDSYPLLAAADCYEKVSEGPCEGEALRWFYDPTDNGCHKFTYGGCGGNGNNFLSDEDCQAYCPAVTQFCGVLQCDLDCPYSLARREDGCPFCECADACQNYQCAPHHECVLEEVQCVRAPCHPVPVCKPISKAGECPALDQDQALCLFECNIDYDCPMEAKCCDTGCGKICASPGVPTSVGDTDYSYTYTDGDQDVYGVDISYGGGDMLERPGTCPPLDPALQAVCLELCANDFDCPYNAKCCYNGCGHVCMLTVHTAKPSLHTTSTTTTTTATPGCAASVFGCCPDGVTTAQGWNFIGCSEEVPVIEPSDEFVIKVEGDSVRLPCKATGAPAPQISWYQNRRPLQADIRDSARLTRYHDGTLEILNLRENDSSNYSCRAYNPVGSDTQTYTLDVQVPPSFHDSTNIDIETKVGREIEMRCNTHGKPQPSIRWLKGEELVVIDGSRVVQEHESTLLIRDIVVEDEGDYRCEANNGAGPPIYKQFTVTVEVPFMVQIEGQRSEYHQGDELLLYCVVPTTEQVDVQWYKDGIPVVKREEGVEVVPDPTEMYVSALSSNDNGIYKCVATVAKETISQEIYIEVQGSDTPDGCEDDPTLANCALIVEANFCEHPYFSVFCCKSCHLANQLR